MPEVSVILPAYNAAKSIARAVRSILDQTLRDIELIVVDDGSEDDTAAIVQEMQDERLRLIAGPHRGVAAAANTGAESATAPVLARMDADDVSHATRLERQLRFLRERNFDVVGCQVRILDETDQRVSSMARYERWINEETLSESQILSLRFVELPLVNPTILARRRYFDLRFRQNDLPEDYDLMLRAAAGGMRFGKVADILFDWHDRPARLTRTDGRYSVAAFTRCRQIHLLSGPLRDVLTVDLWGAGQTGKPWLRWLLKNGMAVRRCYEVSYRKIGKTIHDVAICDPETMSSADGVPLIVAVGAAGARAFIQQHIQQRGFVAGIDAWFVA